MKGRKLIPTEEQRFQVAVMISNGYTKGEVAEKLHIDAKTLSRAFAKEIRHAKRIAVSRIQTKLYAKAAAGDVVCMLFYLKCQAFWRETNRIEHTGADGKALEGPKLGISFSNGGPGAPGPRLEPQAVDIGGADPEAAAIRRRIALESRSDTGSGTNGGTSLAQWERLAGDDPK